MSDTVPTVIETYQKAIVDNNSLLFDECFNNDAIVTDHGDTFEGIEAIKGWGDDLSKMELDTSITDVTVTGKSARIYTHVIGDFPRSPLSFVYALTLKNNKISRLAITVQD